MSVPLYGRRWSLIISQPNSGRSLVYTEDNSVGPPLRFTFAVERTLHSEANKATIAITNMSAAHRSLIGPGSTVILRACYSTQKPGIIFRGTVANVTTNTDKPDTTTQIEAGDGEPYLTSGHISMSYKGVVTLAQILQDICAKLNVEIGGQVYTYEGQVVQQVPRITLPGRVIFGPVKKVLDELLLPLGMQWSIQCGTLIIQNQKGVVKLRATVLNKDTGLIGSPSRTKSGMSCRTLLIPTIAPGTAVQIQSKHKECNGNFRVVSAKYTGDTMGPDWSVDIEGQALMAPLAEYVKDTKTDGTFDGAQEQFFDPELDGEDEGGEQ